MLQTHYKLWERILSGVVFLVSTIVYLITMEKSASMWDTPEFITTFHKLEVGHPPGAPFYMLVYNFFSHLFPSSGSWVAIAANSISAVLSGLTIYFLFKTISHLIRRGYGLRTSLINQRELYPMDQSILGLGGALVGSLLYAFTDTFWYSAVEAEVYSFSSLFTALVFYLMLKWEETEESYLANRWLLLIAYLMGLSVGVHLLNLLAIPAMALIYYFRKTKAPNWKGAIFSILISFALIAIIMFGIIQGVPEVAGWFELLCVNVLGLGFNSGLSIYIVLLLVVLGVTFWSAVREKESNLLLRCGFLTSIILMGIPFMGNGWLLPLLLIALIGGGLFYVRKLPRQALGLGTMSLFLFFLGLSTYGVILIRANSDIPMNQNTPSEVFSLRYYLSREQYGTNPLIYGQTYASLPKYNEKGQAVTTKTTTYRRAPKYTPGDKDRYIAVVTEQMEYRDDMKMFFPRVFSNIMPHFKEGYKIWGNIEGKPMLIQQRGETKEVLMPTFIENLRYFFAYQVNYMYWRYFLWNFSGRQNDLHGQGELTKGNWITGIPFIDSMLLGGPQDHLPSFIKDNPGYNRYFMLPLILGLLGLLMQLFGESKNKENFFIILALFFMTGLAIVLYINQTPYQVRERDYSYAGSFYAFAIWIGFGIPALYNLITDNGKSRKPILALFISIICLGVPALVFGQNYDDHNRDGRTIAIDFGNNYLQSCDPNAILFCNGDNDTFPLWYAQEVEGVRRDIKVCNTSYLQADWYIEQMKRQHYTSSPLPITWGLKEYGGDKRSVAYVFPTINDTIPLRTGLDFIASDDPKLKRVPGIPQTLDYLPTEHLYFKYDPSDLLKRGILYPEDLEGITTPRMEINLKGKNYLGKQELVILDMLENNKFERPMYYCITVGEGEHVTLTKNMRQTGMVLQVLPFKTKETNKELDTERMYRNVTKRFKWGGADIPTTYMDENNRRMCETYRSQVFAKLANNLLEQRDTLRAKEVLSLSETAIRSEVVPHTASSLSLVQAFYRAGERKTADRIVTSMLECYLGDIEWFFQLDPDRFMSCIQEVGLNLAIVSELLRLNEQFKGLIPTEFVEKARFYQDYYLKLTEELNKPS